jgi:MFS family permease
MLEAPATPSPGDEAPESLARANRVLGLLFVIFAINFADRHVLYILSEPIKIELGLSDAQIGLLSGAFAIFYTFAGFPIARRADQGSRKDIIALGMVVWSALTAAGALVRTFPQLLLVRIGVGVGEAACTPAAHSLLSDYFPPARRGRAFAIYGMGGALGGLLGTFVGGHVADAFGWRAAFLVLGTPGILLALVVRKAIIEPPRGETPQMDFFETLRTLSKLRSLRHLLIGAALHAFAIIGVSAFHAIFFMRVHHLSAGQAATTITLMALFGTMVGSYTGGALSDRFGRRDLRWYLWLPAIATAVSIPFSAVFYLSGPLVMSACFGAVASGLGSFYSGPVAAMTQSLVPLRARAFASALFLFANSLIGMGLGPIAVGTLSDLLEPTYATDSVRYALLLVCVTNIWAVIHFMLGARTLRQEVDANQSAQSA